MPFTALKLDKSVVQQAVHDPSAKLFIANVIARAKTGGMSVTAEGIENQPCWNAMQALGAEHAQGYLIARPMEAANIATWLTEWTTRTS
jgi:EAL domain-containing protein (putative c-di-GMP-specific phosphodiesterase class I)